MQGEIPGLPASAEVYRYRGDEKPKMTLEAGRQEEKVEYLETCFRTSVGSPTEKD